MAVTYTFDENVLKMELAGTYTPGDVMSQFVAAINDPLCPIPAALMLDVRRSETTRRWRSSANCRWRSRSARCCSRRPR